ncbi:MAG: hypothetical protein JXA92_00940 [candidate division Zixibacteria bacterium]|nr:hypothetical protein [candidate division Zixibacteria bacterium]
MKTPAADRKVLILLAGLVWSLVGLGLMTAAAYWLAAESRGIAVALGVSIIAGVLIYRLGFSKLALKNIVRIMQQAPGKDKVCLFAFQDTRSYFIVVIMMAMGYTLRHLPLPRIYLVPVYLSLGLGLLLASLRYYSHPAA